MVATGQELPEANEVSTQMTKQLTVCAELLLAMTILASGCGERVKSPSNTLRIEPIAVVESGIARWDPNDDSTLHVHAIGIPDMERYVCSDSPWVTP